MITPMTTPRKVSSGRFFSSMSRFPFMAGAKRFGGGNATGKRVGADGAAAFCSRRPAGGASRCYRRDLALRTAKRLQKIAGTESNWNPVAQPAGSLASNIGCVLQGARNPPSRFSIQMMKRSTKILLALGIVLALVFSSLVAWGVFLFEHERRATLALANAEQAFERKDLDGAIALLSRALEMHLLPAQRATACYERGWSESEKFKYDDAIRDYTEAIRLRYPGIEVYWGRGWAYQCKGEWDKALKDYARVLRTDRSVGNVYFNRGQIFLEQ